MFERRGQQRRTPQNSCRFWDCDETIRAGYLYCYDHYQEYQDGEIDDCPSCGRAKHARYDVCLECYDRQSPPAKSQRREAQPRYREEHSEAWAAGDADATEFYVYILKLDGGRFYAGQTRELRERLMEHRDGTTKSTAGKNPKLVWFSAVATRNQATEFEVELKMLCAKNPREIRRLVLDFKDLVKELNFD